MESIRTQSRDTLDAHVWAMTDGTTGMKVQATALANELLRLRPGWRLNEYVVTPHRLARALPRLASRFSALPIYGASSPGTIEIRPHVGLYPDILITCGRRMAGIALALRKRARRTGHEMRIVQIQDPRLPAHLFDALVVPKHDPVRADNVIVTMGSLNRMSLDAVQQATRNLPQRWIRATSTLAVAVLLGGDNRRYKVSSRMANSMTKKLAHFADANPQAKMLLVSSRRTPKGLVDKVLSKLPPDRVMAPDEDATDIYPGLLGLAQVMIVTSDSVNMACEAAATGRPVLVTGWKSGTPQNPTGESGRIRSFHENMFQAGHTVPLEDDLPQKSFKRLNEINRVAQELLTLLDR